MPYFIILSLSILTTITGWNYTKVCMMWTLDVTRFDTFGNSREYLFSKIPTIVKMYNFLSYYLLL